MFLFNSFLNVYACLWKFFFDKISANDFKHLITRFYNLATKSLQLATVFYQLVTKWWFEDFLISGPEFVVVTGALLTTFERIVY